jgi:hypothetical protein
MSEATPAPSFGKISDQGDDRAVASISNFTRQKKKRITQERSNWTSSAEVSKEFSMQGKSIN